MGFFSNIKNNLRKSESAVIIQKLLEQQADLDLFPKADPTPAEMANKLIQIVWDNNSGISQSNPLPHKMVLAAVGLSSGVLAMDKAGNREAFLAFKFCLGQILMELNASGHRMQLNAIDIHMIEKVQGVYFHFSEN
jgi:hypothetical protein